MKILITGIAGFIGFHIAKKLMNQGHQIVGIDNINDYYDINLKLGRLTQLGISTMYENQSAVSTMDPELLFYKFDITDRYKMESLFHDNQFDIVLHLAAQAGVRYSIENPHAYIDSNIIGFMNILEGCRHNKVKHLIYASSSSVYGVDTEVPFSEDEQVDSPVSLYAATKKSNELMAYTYSHLYQLPTTGLRFFTVYGPWGRPDMAPMLFTNAIMNNKPIKVFNNGDMKRDFTYIDDIVNGVLKLIDYPLHKKISNSIYEIFNIGNSKPIDLMHFIKLLEKNLSKNAKLEMCPMQDGDVKITYADTSKLSSIINYVPNTSLENGLKEFINWYILFKKATKSC